MFYCSTGIDPSGLKVETVNKKLGKLILLFWEKFALYDWTWNASKHSNLYDFAMLLRTKYTNSPPQF